MTVYMDSVPGSCLEVKEVEGGFLLLLVEAVSYDGLRP